MSFLLQRAPLMTKRRKKKPSPLNFHDFMFSLHFLGCRQSSWSWVNFLFEISCFRFLRAHVISSPHIIVCSLLHSADYGHISIYHKKANNSQNNDRLYKKNSYRHHLSRSQTRTCSLEKDLSCPLCTLWTPPLQCANDWSLPKTRNSDFEA